ncbi:MAG: histidine phosphatase family protein [Pedobacter sp.]|nr:MAG: histidine phosphatase family protein [Pedobacter sp.]
MPKILYIIRHGETDLNARGIVQGRGIDSDLNDTGRAQGAAFYELYKNISFDHLYTSTLKRTHQTVKGFIEKGLPWTQLAGLDELAWGIWEGKEGSEASISAFRDMVERWQAGDYTARFEGGESPEEVELRLREAMDTIISATDEETVLICMHGRAMRLLLCILMSKPLAEMADFPHQNTTLYKLSYADGVFDIIDFNNTDHLSS